MRYTWILLILISFVSTVSAQNSVPKFRDYAVDKIYRGKVHPLVLDSFGKQFKTRLRDAISNYKGKPDFAGHYIVTGWGCGTSGCNTGAIIDVETGRAYPFPVALSGVWPLKPEHKDEDGQELVYKPNSRLIMFAGDLDGAHSGDGSDTIEFYEFTNNKFVFIRSMPYGRKDNSQ